jgi:hypothetical protein
MKSGKSNKIAKIQVDLVSMSFYLTQIEHGHMKRLNFLPPGPPFSQVHSSPERSSSERYFFYEKTLA